jgi:hypothetical protein
MKDSIYHTLVSVTEMLEDEQQQVQPTDTFSEYQHIQDRAITLKEKLDNAAEELRYLVHAEYIRRMTPQQRKERRAKQEYHNPLEVVIQAHTQRH